MINNFRLQVKAGGALHANSADEGPIDEEAERLAFQQAVEEWRRADASAANKGKKMEIVREYQRDTKTNSSFAATEESNDDGLWKNPWGAPVDDRKKVGKN